MIGHFFRQILERFSKILQFFLQFLPIYLHKCSQERGQKILRNYEPGSRQHAELGADALSSSLALLWREACTGCGVPVPSF